MPQDDVGLPRGIVGRPLRGDRGGERGLRGEESCSVPSRGSGQFSHWSNRKLGQYGQALVVLQSYMFYVLRLSCISVICIHLQVL